METQIREARILAVDDEPSLLHAIRRILERNGFLNLRVTGDPREALELWDEFQPDVMLLDLQMPGFSGFDVMNALREKLSPDDFFPILVLTGDIGSDVKERALTSGAKDFVNKPFEPTELVLRMRNLLETRLLHRQLSGQKDELERRVAERTEELRGALDAARAADQAKANFLTVMSHELRTPLTAMVNYAELLADGLYGDLTDEQRAPLRTIVSGGWHLDRLVEEILAFADSGDHAGARPAEVDVRNVVGEALALTEPLARDRDLELVSEVPEEPLVVETDPDRLRRILLHLLSNAVKFTDSGGVRLHVERTADGGVRFQVADTGRGIAADDLPRIWESFWQAENPMTRRSQGLGLGLSVVDRLVRSLGGRRDVESTPGDGSEFTVELPARAAESAA